MQPSQAVRAAILRFYEGFSSGDPDAFAAAIAQEPGVSVIGTGPGEGHDERADWIGTYAKGQESWAKGMRLEGKDPRAFEEGTVGFGTDQPAFVLPDGSRLPTRLTAVARREGGEWKIVHLHFSVGVPDEQAVVPAG